MHVQTSDVSCNSHQGLTYDDLQLCRKYIHAYHFIRTIWLKKWLKKLDHVIFTYSWVVQLWYIDFLNCMTYLRILINQLSKGLYLLHFPKEKRYKICEKSPSNKRIARLLPLAPVLQGLCRALLESNDDDVDLPQIWMSPTWMVDVSPISDQHTTGIYQWCSGSPNRLS